jgi:stage II sporulation protein D
MLEKYKVVKEKNEDVLYLYLSMNYEFAKDLDDYNLDKLDHNWLVNQRIQFNGNKVVIFVDGIPTKVILLNDKVRKDKDIILTLDTDDKVSLDTFLLSVLFSNITMFLEKETLKAVTVLYRSEIMKLYKENKKIRKDNYHFSYVNLNYYKLLYPNTYKMYEKVFTEAIRETDGEYLVYDKAPIDAYIHLVSNGYTEKKDGVPYLKQVESFWDLAYPNYMNQRYFTIDELKKRLSIEEERLDIEIKQLSSGNRILKLQVNDKVFDSLDLMARLDLPSADITILVLKNGFNFITRGIGSGYGLSLVGANALAKLDCNYKQILGYYFDNVTLYIKEEAKR